MEELVSKGSEILEAIALVVLALTIVATLIVKFTPSKKDDEAVGSIAEKILKLLAYLPTWGVNPRTKKMEEQLRQLQAEKLKEKELNAEVSGSTDSAGKAGSGSDRDPKAEEG